MQSVHGVVGDTDCVDDATRIRASIVNAETVVIKVGSSSLTLPSGHLDIQKLRNIVRMVAEVKLQGKRVVLVTSGAIAAGFGTLGFTQRPTDLIDQQACASFGQGLLMTQYEQEFAHYHILVGQILLTAQDTIAPQQYRNAQRTLERLLEHNVIPIVNENDALTSSEIRFGDNDRLSALVANLVRADALMLLTDVDGLYTKPPTEVDSEKISFVPNVLDILGAVKTAGSSSNVGTGGMRTKLEAVRIAAVSGIPTLLTATSKAQSAFHGEQVGTVFAPIRPRGKNRRLWIAFAAMPVGTVEIDSGAARAVQGGKASLLSAGVTRVEGEFSDGEVIAVVDSQGKAIARGITSFSAQEIQSMIGKTTEELQENFGEEYAHPVIHRDNLVLERR